MGISNGTFKKFIAGEKRATELVYMEYKNLMFFVIGTYVSNTSDCEDILSDSFIKAIDHRNQIRDPSKIKSYLTTIAKNQALDFLRKQREIPSSDVIDDIYGDKDRTNDFLSTIEPLLTNKETIVVYLRIGFDYTWPELAQETGMSESTVRRIYRAAKEKLGKGLL